MDGVDDNTRHDGPEGPNGPRYKGESNVHRFGLAYVGFGPLKFGVNSEKSVRAGIQNSWHKMLGGSVALWDLLSISDTFFWNFGSTGGSTLW